MPTEKINVTVQAASVARIDHWVRQGRYPNRSQAFQAALDLLEARNARPTLQEALARRAQLTDEQRHVLQRESEAIDAEADAMNQPDASAA